MSVEITGGSRTSPGLALRRFGKYVALAQYGFPFTLGPCPTPVARFRALARRSRFQEQGAVRQWQARCAMTLLWPWGALTTSWQTWRRMRRHGRQPAGFAVLADMYWLALRHSIPPLEYALYGFADPARRRTRHEYVYWNDLPGLTALIARTGADNRDVQDKDRFADLCRAHGLPHVETLAVFDAGRQIRPATPFRPDAPTLWTKSLRLKGGAGGAKWVKDGDAYRNAAGERVPAADMARILGQRDSIVQPFVENHPDLARLSNGALAALRIVTGMNGRGEAELIASLLTLPHGDRPHTTGGILCAVAHDDGRIRHAAMPGGEPVARHPDTGVPIVGTALPFWAESVALVRRAHAMAFPRFVFLGWDIALTATGPLLLETNSGWGALFHQMLDGPLGGTAFSRLVANHV